MMTIAVDASHTLLAQAQQVEGLHRLIVLLVREDRGGPRPEDVVAAINSVPADRESIPGGLGVGQPIRAQLTISRRTAGRQLARIAAIPDSPVSRLQRYITLEYGHENLEDIQAALNALPAVGFVEVDRPMRLHAASAVPPKFLPTDPLVGTGGTDPTFGQWALHLLRLPEAWDYLSGTARVGTLDRGVQVSHPQLRAFSTGSQGEDTLGPFRAHHARDLAFNNCGVDELDPEDGVVRNRAGHGTHVAGLLTSAADGLGGVGLCWGCSLHVMKVDPDSGEVFLSRASNAINRLLEDGVQAINMSFGLPGEDGDGFGEAPCEEGDLRILCMAIAAAADREVVLVASSGNDRKAIVDFPANSVIAVGGLEWAGVGSDGLPRAAFWDDWPACPYDPPFPVGFECGSNFGIHQDLTAPARTVISTMYEGKNHNEIIDCGDEFLPGESGYGPCTGTSMAAPQVVGIVALLLSSNPWLTAEEVYDILTSTASSSGSWHPQLGFGIPDAGAAVRRAQGTVAGMTLANRLTPLLSLFGRSANPDPFENPDFRKAETHVYTTNPQGASGLLLRPGDPFETVGPGVPFYISFPGVSCTVSPCDMLPRASIYLFTSDRSPFPGAPPLVPLLRMIYDPDLFADCDPDVLRVPHRDFAYTTTVAGARHFHDNVVDANGIGYEFDGVAGFLFRSCEGEPGCRLPPGTVKIYRMYNAERDDYAVFPESELAAMQAQGYVAQPGLATILGYAYPTVDSDQDGLIDGWEGLIGTDPNLADSDCDGQSDGAEVLRYNRNQHSYGDPLDGSCGTVLFADGFESGGLLQWSRAES